MKITDKGVLPASFMDFSLPSTFAQSALYYSLQFGHFFCNNEYFIDRRNYLNSFLLIYIQNGELFFREKERAFIATNNQIILLDCRIPHTYGCKNNCNFIWFHFTGNKSLEYYGYLAKRYGNVFNEHTNNPVLLKKFANILALERKPVINEHQVSADIHQILSYLAAPEKNAIVNELLYPAINYISKNFDQMVNLQFLANLCCISLSHFIRCFKKYLNCTPHEYLLLYRLRQAKYLLSASKLSVEEIADRCGFNSASHFTRTFKRINRVTPSEFRNKQL